MTTALSTVDKAQASKLASAPREAKMAYIVGLCARMRIVRGSTIPDLALIWGVSTSTVAAMVREAKSELASVIKATVGSPEEMMHEFLGELEYIKSDAMNAKKAVVLKNGEVIYVDAPDRRAAIAAIDAAVNLLALGSGPGKKSPYEDKTKDELQRLADETIAKIREERRTVDTEGTETNEAEVVPVEHAVQAGARNVPERLMDGGGAGSGEHRGQRTRSSDLVHPRPGPPSSAPKRIRKNPQAKAGGGEGR